MSYDVGIGNDSYNYTYNLAKLFHEHIPGGIYGLKGMTGAKASKIVNAALSEIKARPEAELDAYNAANGWGDWRGAVQFLEGIAASCSDHPRKKVRVG